MLITLYTLFLFILLIQVYYISLVYFGLVKCIFLLFSLHFNN